MLKIEKRYRKDYTGEEIITERVYKNQTWTDSKELVQNTVINNQISNRAVVIGNGISRQGFELRHIANHRGGLLGEHTLQSYGCNALYRDFVPDFLVARGKEMVSEIANSEFVNDNIVYADSASLLAHPKKFYLIPYDPYTDAGTTALYLAAFDGHKRIYMLGFDNNLSNEQNYNIYADTACYRSIQSVIQTKRWLTDRKTVFNTYNDVDFVRVVPNVSYPIPVEWKACVNFRQITTREFVLEADI